MKVDLLIIDPQVDFCDPAGALYVGGADKDSERLAAMIDRVGKKIRDIHVTLDTHHKFHIAHPVFWVGPDGRTHPKPFTMISEDDVKHRIWRTLVPQFQNRKTMEAAGIQRDGAEEYVHSLFVNGRYVLVIWPPHCLIGTPGHNVIGPVRKALSDWEDMKERGYVDYVTKGSNFWTEHYSAFQADVIDMADPSTAPNMKLVDVLQEADLIGISGQALSHCVANTITDIANNFGEDNIKKFVLIEDTCSNVGTFEALGQKFVKELTARGMQTAKAADFLA